jgi:cob(I)alamin adenosyltransferase
MSPSELMLAADSQLAHVWMVRAFLKHSDEAQEDDELAEVHRELYDFMLALGGPLKDGNADEYLRLARKKLAKLKKAAEKFAEIQPQVSTHTNFQMAVTSLRTAVGEVARLLESRRTDGSS